MLLLLVPIPVTVDDLSQPSCRPVGQCCSFLPRLMQWFTVCVLYCIVYYCIGSCLLVDVADAAAEPGLSVIPWVVPAWIRAI